MCEKGVRRWYTLLELREVLSAAGRPQGFAGVSLYDMRIDQEQPNLTLQHRFWP